MNRKRKRGQLWCIFPPACQVHSAAFKFGRTQVPAVVRGTLPNVLANLNEEIKGGGKGNSASLLKMREKGKKRGKGREVQGGEQSEIWNEMLVFVSHYHPRKGCSQCQRLH